MLAATSGEPSLSLCARVSFPARRQPAQWQCWQCSHLQEHSISSVCVYVTFSNLIFFSSKIPLMALVAVHAVLPSAFLACLCLVAAAVTIFMDVRSVRISSICCVFLPSFQSSLFLKFRECFSLLCQLIHHANGPCVVLAVALCHVLCASLPSPWQLRVAGFVGAGSMGLALSVSSVPLSGAFVFVGDRYVAWVVFLTGFAGVAAPHWIASCFVRPANVGEQCREELRWAAAMALAACCSAMLQREHLFVWSVFGPMVAWQVLYLAIALSKCGVFLFSKK